MITRAHCARFVGQHVVFQTRDGIHHGILHSISDDGIFVRPVGGSTTRLAAAAELVNDKATLLQNLEQHADVKEAWYPFFFFPFLALLWLLPWAWWW